MAYGIGCAHDVIRHFSIFIHYVGRMPTEDS
jgi:hypothetical protein